MRMIAGLLFALALALGLPRLAQADDISPADQDAFRRDDGNAAYGFASPTIQGLYPSPDQFMSMVRNAYQPVYRPRSVTFGQLSDSPYGPLQKVFLVGPDGKSYVAVYSLQRQPDGTWRINGCTLVEDTGATI